MKGIVAAAAVALAACSSAVPSASVQTPQAGSPAAASPSPTPAVSPSPTALAVVVDTAARPDNTYLVYLVGLNGLVVAKAQAKLPPPITTWVSASPIANLWSTYATASNDRAYYLDGGTSVRYIAADGSTGEVAHVQANSSSRSFFSVSPDDSQIAVSTYDYSSPPTVHTSFYVQDLGGGPQQPYRGPANTFFYPIGWHQGRVVVQASRGGDAIPQTLYGAYPDDGAEFLLIDPISGSISAVGRASCAPPSSLASPAGVLCLDPVANTFTVLGWDGSDTSFSGGFGSGGASLSTDGRRVATSDARGVWIAEPGGPTLRFQVAGYPGEAGWLDADHFVFRLAGSDKEVICDVAARTVTTIGVDGRVVGRLPGGL